MADLAEDVNEIKSKISQNNATLVNETVSIFTILHLPVDNDTDLQNLENYLNDDAKMNSAVRSHCDSLTITSKIYSFIR